jgi:hypothetical protein
MAWDFYDALRFALRVDGLTVTQSSSITLSVSLRDRNQLSTALQKINTSEIKAAELAEMDENLVRAKYDHYISRELLRQAAAADRLSVESLPQVCCEILTGLDGL